MLADAARRTDAQKICRTVVKIGGSLLNFPELSNRLDTLLRSRPGRLLLVVGGGITDYLLRLCDFWFSLGEVFCHDLAIRHLSLTAERVQKLLPNSRTAFSLRDATETWNANEIPVLNLEHWLPTPEAAADCVPQSWDVTSDSLAAWVAQRWQADCLLLLKSTDLPVSLSAVEASQRELVDRAFPRFAAGVPRVHWCNLRSDPIHVQSWW